MQVNMMNKKDFIQLVHSRTDDFLHMVNTPEVFIIKGFYDSGLIIDFRNYVFDLGQKSLPSWHPLHDDCPDYHRLHDNYPNAYVKTKMHAFYFHGWYSENKTKFELFREIFNLKNKLTGVPEDSFLTNIPSQGFIARVNVHHYPQGGGYQAEHIDPVNKFNLIQTIIQASWPKKDFKSGGVYGRKSSDSERFFIDAFTEPGDLIVMSPRIHHGVDPIDPDLSYDWNSNRGRWMIMPIIVASDYPNPETSKPFEVVTDINGT